MSARPPAVPAAFGAALYRHRMVRGWPLQQAGDGWPQVSGKEAMTDYRYAKVAALPDKDYPRVKFRGPYFDPHDTWVGLYWVHDIQGWDGGWWEGWRFYLVLLPAVVLKLDIDRSNRDTRAYRRWKAAHNTPPGCRS